MRNIILIMLTALAAIACTRKAKLEDECLYNESKTKFAFWSSVAEQMELHLYNDAETADFEAFELKKDRQGFWRSTVKGNLAGKFYM